MYLRVWDFILSHLQDNKLSCCSFLEAGRRHESLGSDTKDFITHRTARSTSITPALVPTDVQVP